MPLRPALAADLKRHMTLFLPTAKTFAKMGTDCGAEMIRTDLETAGIVTRNANGEQTVTDPNGAVYDFHGLRHTFATMLNKARVPLATAQRLMRHSDPKLTAGIYTHVLVADKADELAKLPEIAATVTTEKEAATGTCDPTPESGKIIVMPVDSFGMDLMAKIKTYGDGGNKAIRDVWNSAGNEKNLLPQGEKGGIEVGGGNGAQIGLFWQGAQEFPKELLPLFSKCHL